MNAKSLIMKLAWAYFRQGFGTHSECLKLSWAKYKGIRSDIKPRKRKLVFTSDTVPKNNIIIDRSNGPSDLRDHLPDRGSPKNSSVYRKVRHDYESDTLVSDRRFDLNTKSQAKTTYKLANRNKWSGPPKGFFSSQRLVGDYRNDGFKY